MAGTCYPRCVLNNSNGSPPAPLPPSCASSATCLCLLAAPVALIFWLHGNLHLPPPEWGPDQIPAVREDAAEEVEAEVAAAAVLVPRTPPRAEQHHPGGSRSITDNDSACAEVQQQALVRGNVDRSAEADGILNKMVNALKGMLLDIHSSDELTVHPANGLLIGALESARATEGYTIESFSSLFGCWESKLEEDAERMWQGEKGLKYIFLLNNAFDVRQTMRRPGASFLVAEPVITAIIERYKKSYINDCWVPLNSIHPLDKFTSEFLTVCSRHMTWKVTAELKYNLRKEIVDLIVPPYKASLFALQAKRSRISGVLYWLKRVMAGKKNQKKYTCEQLEMVITELYEG